MARRTAARTDGIHPAPARGDVLVRPHQPGAAVARIETLGDEPLAIEQGATPARRRAAADQQQRHRDLVAGETGQRVELGAIEIGALGGVEQQ